ncbi:hypothetical protein PYCCODRAFT_552142 [Trametes coccinea BRFM310]|uniref:Uncharacterized protein n=1 Tax=Trametes coccinea (strain BRFM310) TaxID=1353009 RepID=A0A1Y2ILT2_TRAC3|nr:hypothetical protein PYCCODRAFT_552142 [Trametes coccinea BRFM310]
MLKKRQDTASLGQRQPPTIQPLPEHGHRPRRSHAAMGLCMTVTLISKQAPCFLHPATITRLAPRRLRSLTSASGPEHNKNTLRLERPATLPRVQRTDPIKTSPRRSHRPHKKQCHHPRRVHARAPPPPALAYLPAASQHRYICVRVSRTKQHNRNASRPSSPLTRSPPDSDAPSDAGLLFSRGAARPTTRRDDSVTLRRRAVRSARLQPAANAAASRLTTPRRSS